MFKRGLIVGKFCPLHKGHEYLIKAAAAQCEHLYILSYTNPEFEGCGPKRRRKWLNAIAPNAKILVLTSRDKLPPNSAPDNVHREFTAKAIWTHWNLCPDAVFSSEDYGDGFAAYLSEYFHFPVKHINIDQKRTKVDISGTKIRENIYEARKFLSSNVYTDFVKSVCFIGAESTGKSSLSKALARIFSTEYVDEYGRTLWIEKNGDLGFDDYVKIATTHIDNENKARLSSNRFLFVDTSPLTTLFYALEQFGKADEQLIALSRRRYNHIFLCHADFPMVQDGWRSDEDFRSRQHDWYVKTLADQIVPYTNLVGSFDDKIATVKATLLQNSA